jgi:monoamine oxidase
MSSRNFDADVIVIGGGLAGLRAATALKAGGASVLVLEARDRLGGRTHARLLDGAAFDFGGQFIGPGQARMYRLVGELGLKLAPTHVAGRNLIELDGIISDYAGSVPFLNPLKLVPLLVILGYLEMLARKVPPDAPWSATRAAALDALTIEAARQPSWAIGTDVRRLMDVAVRMLLGAEAGELSMLNFLWLMSSNGGLAKLTETRGGFQQDRVVGGAQQIAERLSTALGEKRMVLGTVVQTIRQDADGVTVESSPRSWRANRVVVAVPLTLAKNIRFEPALPAGRSEIHHRVTMGSTVKVLATYERAFWRDRGLSGNAIGTSGAISVTFDNTSHDESVPCLLGFVVGHAARRFAAMPREQRRAQVLDELSRLFGPEAKTPRDYAEMDWGEEPFSGGCPIGNFQPGALAAYGGALRSPVGRIHWAGTETARQCMGYMEGALESGDRAAAEVLARLP